MVVQIHIGLIRLAAVVERSDPELEQLLQICPALRSHPICEHVHEADAVEGLGECMDSWGRREGDEGLGGEWEIGTRVGVVVLGVSPVLLVEGAA